jgi:hypothetical protein
MEDELEYIKELLKKRLLEIGEKTSNKEVWMINSILKQLERKREPPREYVIMKLPE